MHAQVNLDFKVKSRNIREKNRKCCTHYLRQSPVGPLEPLHALANEVVDVRLLHGGR